MINTHLDANPDLASDSAFAGHFLSRTRGCKRNDENAAPPPRLFLRQLFPHLGFLVNPRHPTLPAAHPSWNLSPRWFCSVNSRTRDASYNPLTSQTERNTDHRGTVSRSSPKSQLICEPGTNTRFDLEGE